MYPHIFIHIIKKLIFFLEEKPGTVSTGNVFGIASEDQVVTAIRQASHSKVRIFCAAQ
jgi:predicted ThiF/HesA family dinucleotide-utilizing enzyme